MADWQAWFEQYYAAEYERFRAWCERAVSALNAYTGESNASYSISWMAGVGGVALLRAYCPRISQTFGRYVDTGLAYSFQEDWYRFAYWFFGYHECARRVEAAAPPSEAPVFEYRARGGRYVDPNKARAVWRAIRVIV